MKRRRNYVILIVLAAVCAGVYVAASDWRGGDQRETEERTELSAWIADWAMADGLADAASIGALASVHWFAVYFDEQDQFVFTEAYAQHWDEYLQLSDRLGSDAYLTIVNDVWLPDGTAVQKDADLVSRLVANPERRRQHVQDLVNLAHAAGVRGLELDYERIDDADWPRLIALYEELAQELQSSGVQLRVILEPRAPVERLSLPEGPEYVMMAYNLYGFHSGPGPKADYAFLQEVATRMKHVPGDAIVALSMGGFSWNEHEQARSLTERQAQELVVRYAAQTSEDEASGARYFMYEDDEGMRHTVWYADHGTMQSWTAVLAEAGVSRIALWRLGGLGEQTIEVFAELARSRQLTID